MDDQQSGTPDPNAPQAPMGDQGGQTPPMGGDQGIQTPPPAPMTTPEPSSEEQPGQEGGENQGETGGTGGSTPPSGGVM